MQEKCPVRIVDEYILLLPFDPKTFLFELLKEHHENMGETFDENTTDFDELFPLLSYMNIHILEDDSEQQEAALLETHPHAKIVKALLMHSKKMSLHYNITGESNTGKTIFALSFFSPVFDVHETDSGELMPLSLFSEQRASAIVIGNDPRYEHKVEKEGNTLLLRDICEALPALTVNTLDSEQYIIPLEFVIGSTTIFTEMVKHYISQHVGCWPYFTLVSRAEKKEVKEGDVIDLNDEYDILISEGLQRFGFIGWTKDVEFHQVNEYESTHRSVYRLFHQDEDDAMWVYEIKHSKSTGSSYYGPTSRTSVCRVQLEDHSIMDDMTRVDPNRFSIHELDWKNQPCDEHIHTQLSYHPKRCQYEGSENVIVLYDALGTGKHDSSILFHIMRNGSDYYPHSCCEEHLDIVSWFTIRDVSNSV